jgi:cyclopropane fatty-acyl-phospholipid synthase-like methyltransferase
MSQDEHRAALDARRAWWENHWSDVQPDQPSHGVPTQVCIACEQQWFAPGARLLELGCGTGGTASWLARAGYRVTAIDFSRTAIERARGAHQEDSRLTFVDLDITSGPPPGGPFTALVDWGCLQGVPQAGRRDYVRNLAAVSDPDARLLLFHRAPRSGEITGLIGSIEELLAREFELAGAEECMSAAPTGQEWPGVALRFRRRGN